MSSNLIYLLDFDSPANDNNQINYSDYVPQPSDWKEYEEWVSQFDRLIDEDQDN